MAFLEIKELNKSFGGLYVAQGINLSIAQRELTAIIGPNGAGKTTLFNLVTGYLRPDSGEVIFKDKYITKLPPFKIARAGISRAFQLVNVFPQLTALENVRLGLLSSRKMAGNWFSNIDNFKKVYEDALAMLDEVGLSGTEECLAGSLPHGHQKSLELGIALTYKPELLLLDEPTAGMNPEESASVMDLVKKIWQNSNIAVVFIEHDMDVVFHHAKRVIVMYDGKIIADGEPDIVQKNGEVRRVYLGA